MRYLVMALAAGALLSAACSGGGGDDAAAASYPDAQALHAALADDGIDCAGFDINDEPDAFAATQGACTFDGESVEIYTFKDAGVRRNFVGLGTTFSCSFGLEILAWVEGDRWVIWPESETTARAIKDTFGGDVRTRECGDDNGGSGRPIEPMPTIPLIPTIDPSS